MHRLASTLYGLRSGKLSCRYSVLNPYRQQNDPWTSHFGGASPPKDSKLLSSKCIISHFLPRRSLEISRARRRGVTATASTVGKLENTSDVVHAVDIECDGGVAVEFLNPFLLQQTCGDRPSVRFPPWTCVVSQDCPYIK